MDTGSTSILMTGHALARWHEACLQAAAHPVIALIAAMASRRGPIMSVPGVGHLVSDLILAKEVLGSPERFAKKGPGSVSDGLTGILGPNALVNMDGEAHRTLRARLGPIFSQRSVDALVRSSFTDALGVTSAMLAQGRTVDLVRLGHVLTGRIACSILGVQLEPGREEATCLDLHRLGAEFASIATLTGRSLDGERANAARTRFASLTDIARQAHERGDGSTVPGRLRSLGLTFEESRGVIGLLLLAGTETVASALPRVVALLVDSGLWPTLRERRDLLPQAVDEGLRLTAAVPVMTRNVVEPTQLGGKRLEQDDRVIVLLFKALRSKRMGSEPLRIDLSRPRAGAVPQPWFGHGPHFCMGAALARRELEVALTALLDAGTLTIACRRYAWRSTLPGYGRIEVRCVPG